METKIIGLILLICSALLFRATFEDVLDSFFSPAATLKATIEKDVVQSLSSTAPEAESNIRRVVVRYRSEEAEEFFKKHQPKFKLNKNGKYWLEIEVIEVPDDKDPGIITQTSVFDVKTNNKINEYGKTYPLRLPKMAKLQIPVLKMKPTNEKSR